MFAVLLHYTHNRARKIPTNTTSRVPIIAQICKLIPGHMIRKIVIQLAAEMKKQGKVRFEKFARVARDGEAKQKQSGILETMMR